MFDHVHLLSNSTIFSFGWVHFLFGFVKKTFQGCFFFSTISSSYPFHSYTFHSFTFFNSSSFYQYNFDSHTFFIRILFIRMLNFIRILFRICILFIRTIVLIRKPCIHILIVRIHSVCMLFI